jgi:acyl-coenzyme A thioesterase PaaI-like protein
MATQTLSPPSVITLSASQEKHLANINNPLKMWFFLFYKLPSALFMGVRIKKITPERGEVTLPYGWKSQNPFNSIYFAAQAAAAELSTGALGLLALEGRGKVSMLVSHIEMEFTKKATSLTTFTCEQGAEVFEVVERAIQTKTPQSITMVSKGVQSTGELVSVTKVTWTFKAK